MALHIINRSPTDTACWNSCLAALAPGDALLLIEDGVYAALPAHATKLPAAEVALYVLQPDLEARGVQPDPRLKLASDQVFVELSCEHAPVVSWF